LNTAELFNNKGERVPYEIPLVYIPIIWKMGIRSPLRVGMQTQFLAKWPKQWDETTEDIVIF
jgi:hypothetical protein